MLRARKKATVATAIVTSATQKAVSQLCFLAMVLKGRPAMKAPTATKRESVFGHANAGDTASLLVDGNLPFAIRATTACEVPQKFEGALSLAITPNKAIGP